MSEPAVGPQSIPSFTSHRLYPAEEVDAYVQTLLAQIDDLQRAVNLALERAEVAEKRAGNFNDAAERVGQAFVVAQEAADATLHEAELSAASVVSEARRRAELLLAKARDDALAVVDSARQTVADLYDSTRRGEDEEPPPEAQVINLEEPLLPRVKQTFEPHVAAPPANPASAKTEEFHYKPPTTASPSFVSSPALPGEGDTALVFGNGNTDRRTTSTSTPRRIPPPPAPEIPPAQPSVRADALDKNDPSVVFPPRNRRGRKSGSPKGT